MCTIEQQQRFGRLPWGTQGAGAPCPACWWLCSRLASIGSCTNTYSWQCASLCTISLISVHSILITTTPSCWLPVELKQPELATALHLCSPQPCPGAGREVQDPAEDRDEPQYVGRDAKTPELPPVLVRYGRLLLWGLYAFLRDPTKAHRSLHQPKGIRHRMCTPALTAMS